MNEFEKARVANEPTLVELFRPGDEKCREMEPVVAELKARFAGKAQVIAVDGTAHPDVMKEYKVASYPCWLLFKDGQVVWRTYGRPDTGELEQMVRDFV